MAKKNPDGFIPDEEDLLSGTSKKNARFSVSPTITGRGTHTVNFMNEVDARNYMKKLRDEIGIRIDSLPTHRVTGVQTCALPI